MSAWPLKKRTWSEAETGPSGKEVPALDLAQPAEVETATFALG